MSAEVKAIIHVTTYMSTGCPFYCRDSGMIGGENFQAGVNHLLNRHGCTLLHVGSETQSSDGGAWLASVATLGSPEPLPAPPANRFTAFATPNSDRET